MRFFLFFLIATFFVLSGSAKAQDQFPEFLLTPDTQIIEPALDPADDVDIILKSPLMRDIIYLQEQINLLEGLVERQAAIQRIASNYESAGIPYRQPPPSIDVCRKLPPNMLCLFFYPTIEINQDFLVETRERIREKSNQAMMESLENYNFGGDVAPPLPDLSQIDSFTQYAWSDIECRMNNCSALIVSSDDEDMRLRAREGMQIAPDVKVAAIKAGGVTLLIDGQEKSIQPVSLDGDMMAENDPSPSVEELLSENRPDTTNQPENRSLDMDETVGNDVGEPSSVMNEAPAPLLGPTGLF